MCGIRSRECDIATCMARWWSTDTRWTCAWECRWRAWTPSPYSCARWPCCPHQAHSYIWAAFHIYCVKVLSTTLHYWRLWCDCTYVFRATSQALASKAFTHKSTGTICALLSIFPVNTRNTPEPMPTMTPQGPYILSIQPVTGSR